MHIQIDRVHIDAGPATVAERHHVAARLENLGHIDASQGEVNTQTSGYTATIDGVTMPLISFAVEPADGEGQALVSLVVAADSVSVGRSPASGPAPATAMPETAQVRTWGDPSIPDPRERMFGSLGQQVARNAEVGA